MADTSDDKYNLYKECRECGTCCEIDIIAMTHAEVERIREYVAEHDLTPKDYGRAICPFRGDDMRCTIYEVRPNTCRLHNCSVPRHALVKENPSLDIPDDLPLVDLRLAFLHGQEIDPRSMPVEWIIDHYSDS